MKRVTVAALSAIGCLAACGGRLAGSSDAPDAGTTNSDAATMSVDAAGKQDATTSPNSPDAPASEGSDAEGYDASVGVEAAVDALATDALPVDGSPEDAAAMDAFPADALPTVVCDAGEPVEECVEYYAALGACFGQDYLYLACQSSLIPDGGDYEQIEQFCAVNLQRIEQACQ